jgi:glutamate-ammonia-ligase adenylyltransferase
MLLADKKYLQNDEVKKLISAYWFLRKLENRLQMRRDMQTHELPQDELEQLALCLAMNSPTWNELLKILSQHQAVVDAVFQNLISLDVSETNELGDSVSPIVLFWDDLENSEEVHQHLIDLNYQDADEIFKLLIQLRSSSQLKQLTSESHNRLAQLISSLLPTVAHYANQYELLERVTRLLKSLAGRKVYISLLVEYPKTQEKMLQLCAASEWFTTRLLNHPILLDSLLSIELNTDIVAEQQDDLKQLLEIELKQIESNVEGSVNEEDLEQQMDRMRQFKRKTVFSVAVSDVFYQQPVELVSDRLTNLANVLLEKILDFAWRAMAVKYGKPVCVIEGEVFHPTMSIVAYGKMGGNELGYGSDLDIIFLHNSAGDKQCTDGEKSIDNQHFFARVAQRVIHFLNTRTYSGVLYEADTRLRPNGQSGLMVSSVAAFELYQREKAWTWEHQALIRARFVTDNLPRNVLIEQEFDRIRSSVLRQSVDARQLLKDVVAMREKMREHLTSKSVEFDIKQDAGGLVDIEFMTQAGILIHAEEDEQCISHTATLELINELGQVGWYRAEETENLSQAYRYFRKLKNWQNLQCSADSSDVPAHRDKVIAVWNRLMPDAMGDVEKE